MQRGGTTRAEMPPYGGYRCVLFPLAARLPVLALLAVVVSFVPYGVDYTFNPDDGMVNVVKSEAHAATVVSNAGGFITLAASAAGLSEGDFIATCVGVVAASTGMNIANQSAVSMGSDAAHNLNALLDTADYPAYSTLTEEQQQAWGSKENYDAAKFNSLMTAFGMGSTVSSYYQSGGGNFEFDEDVQEKLEQIGRIGMLWGEGAYNLLGNLRGLIPNRSLVVSGYLGLVETFSFDATGRDDWPEGVPRNVIVASGTKFGWYSVYNRYYEVYLKGSTSNVYYIMWVYDSGSTLYPWEFQYMFSSNPFVYGERSGRVLQTDPFPEITNYQAAGLHESEYGNYYRVSSSGNNYMTNTASFLQPVNDYRGTTYDNYDLDKAVDIIATSGNIQSSVDSDISGYPDDVDTGGSNNTPIYYPDDGVSPDTTWDDLTTEPQEPPYVPPGPDERPENPYNPSDPSNPGYQSGTPEWKQETKENLTPLLNVRLDKLFPFCLLYDLNMLWGKVQGLMQQGGGLSGQDYVDYLHVRFPVEMVSPSLGIDIHEELEFDLTPLHELLLMTKQMVLVLLIVMTLLSIIQFWKRILTGG